MVTKYGSGDGGRNDLDRVAAEASARTDAKVKSGKTFRSKEVIWHQLVVEKYPHAVPEVFDAAAKARFALLEEAWGWERMVQLMRFGISEWVALREIGDRKYDQVEFTPNFRQFYALRDRIASRWSAMKTREDDWQKMRHKSREQMMEIQKAWEESKDDSPGLQRLRDVMKELEAKYFVKRAS